MANLMFQSLMDLEQFLHYFITHYWNAEQLNMLRKWKQLTEYREIPLTKGFVTKVDADMYEELSKYKWLYANGYARFCYWDKKEKRYKWLALHRMVINCPDDMLTDHINGDKLDNRSENLRIATKKQNNINMKKQSGRSSIYKGVAWDKRRNKWVSYICNNRKHKFLGYFENEAEAGLSYNQMAKELFGEFAVLNKIDEVL